MNKGIDKIDYDKLIEKALKHVVIDALKIVEKQGLPGDNHFYITFRTDHPQTEIDDFLKEQYPHEMTIVLQNQFENLQVEDDGFSVVLRFNRVPYRLSIPFDAITFFSDPSERMGLNFESEIDSTPQKKTSKKQAEVISIDSFRKKNA